METQYSLWNKTWIFNISFINSYLILTGKNLHSIAGQKQALQVVSLRVSRFFPVSIIPLYLSQSLCSSYEKDKREKRGNLQIEQSSFRHQNALARWILSLTLIRIYHVFCKRCRRWIIREQEHNSSDDNVSAPYFHAVAFQRFYEVTTAFNKITSTSIKDFIATWQRYKGSPCG